MNIFTRFFDWLDGIFPVQCVYCNHIFAKKNMEYERSQTGAIVPLCHDCHKLLYNPFSDE